MKLYLVRHGETDVNRILNHGVSGPMHSEQVIFKEGDDTNINLNIYGREQAKEASSLLPEYVDKIYSSPLLRAKDTAEIIAREKKIDLNKIILRSELIEYHQGSLEGLSQEKKKELVPDKSWGSGLLCNYDYTKWGGDSWKDIYDRIDTFLEEIKQNTGEQEVVVCVTSAGIIRMTYKILFSDRAPDISKHINIPNGSVHEFVF